MPKILIKRGTVPVGTQLDLGEFGFKYDTYELYIGTGVGNTPVRVSTWKEYSSDHTVLVANTAEQPVAITIGTNQVLGRLTGDIIALSGSDLWSILNGQATTDISMNGNRITSLGTPISDADAVTKKYVDDLVAAGLTFHEAVLDKDLTSPPTTPSVGDRYWIAPGATDDWSGHDYEIAEWNGSQWIFYPVTDGDCAYVTDENIFYFYDADATDDKRKKLSLGAGPHASTHHATGSDPLDVKDLADSQNNLLTNAFTAKGDLLVGTGSGTYAVLAVGSDGQVLMADSSETSGLKWANVATSFIGLTDTPSSYTGYGSYILAVKSSEDGIEFIDVIDGGTLS
ncbi:MAG: hypothetical protein DRO12_05530 [Thermoprotei archaeon]|nr:MAG: hypothetical protein DRO12_05530 [Thermoprotei archaeon]